jgi:cysteine synthase A
MEIWQDKQGEVDSFVSAVGTGGTITSVSEVLKEKRPGARIIGVEFANAAILLAARWGIIRFQQSAPAFHPKRQSTRLLP